MKKLMWILITLLGIQLTIMCLISANLCAGHICRG